MEVSPERTWYEGDSPILPEVAQEDYAPDAVELPLETDDDDSIDDGGFTD